MIPTACEKKGKEMRKDNWKLELSYTALTDYRDMFSFMNYWLNTKVNHELNGLE